MLEYIEKLQRKPESTRRKILHLSVLSLMGVIVLAWLLTLGTRFDGAAETQDESRNDPSPISVFAEQGQGLYEDFQRGLERLKERF